MVIDSLNLNSTPERVMEGGSKCTVELIEENIKSSIKSHFKKNIVPVVNDLLDLVSVSSQQCKQMLNDVSELEQKLSECINIVEDAKKKVPEQVVQVDENNILEASKQQKLPPHLVNRLMSRSSLAKPGAPIMNHPKSSVVRNSFDPFTVEPPPLPPYIQPNAAIQIDGNILILPVQPAIRLLASAVDGGISIRGELDPCFSAATFQPASTYELFSFTPTGNDSMRIHLGIAWTKIAVITASQLPFNFVAVNLPPNNVHFFVIRGIDVLGRIGPWSNIVKAVTS
nr:Activating transcription factor 7 interacting [Hymenolepis microstoma]